MDVFESLESNVRSYCRNYPIVFSKSEGCILEAENKQRYIDFFSGAGTLNYGHNHPQIKEALLDYIKNNGVVHSLDMFTESKREFLKNFNRIILEPRNMEYKIQFCNVTGTNSVESALKLARKITGRSNVITFTNAFHGMTLGSLSITGAESKRNGAGVSLNNAIFMPYDGYFGENVDTIEYIEKYLDDPSSGIDAPAAFIVETIQGEGGINIASAKWLNRLQALSKKYNSLMIVDDIQVGCGRTGTFFSFEEFADISPDFICLSKSLSGYGIPFSILLIKPEHDVWKPGEHNGTFRGNNLAFVTANESLKFWSDPEFQKQIQNKAVELDKMLEAISNKYNQFRLKGRGLIRGVEFNDPVYADRILKECFAKGLIIETSGARDQVVKILPPINIESSHLQEGINILEETIRRINN